MKTIRLAVMAAFLFPEGGTRFGYEDFGGGENHDIDETITDEPDSPETYTPPAPPAPSTPEPAPSDSGPTTSDGQPDASAGTDSGSATADHDDGATEEHGGQSYEVEAGGGEDHGDLNQIQEDQHGSETVEPAVQDDGVNEGDLDPSDVE